MTKQMVRKTITTKEYNNLTPSEKRAFEYAPKVLKTGAVLYEYVEKYKTFCDRVNNKQAV